MGIKLVQRAIEHASVRGIPHDSFRVLTAMASKALDTENHKGDEPCLYFAGHLNLASALGYGYQDRPSVSSTAALKAVQRAVKVLVDNGLVEVQVAHSRYPSVYDLAPLWALADESKLLVIHRKRVPMTEVARHALSTRKDTRCPPETTRAVHQEGHALSTPREDPCRTH